MDYISYYSTLFRMVAGVIVFYLAVLLLTLISIAKVFKKAGKPGWAVIVPIYNIIVLLEIVKKPLWWFFLLFIPIVNVIISIIIDVELAKKFGQGVGFAIGLIFLPFIFYPILGFGEANYKG